ncbi:tRNA N(3)-methylcytidine methyltransferase METTL6 isoform X2 [Impatiens glandulifera]|uniref:tRNA N(3)-methylcytidine methyltransferase METTL6 isoform X2 n=1 Tax=Impatiens glandulifera TaxID=253017 RepID=UPI001FB0E31C|nr:tRNA N(3)-methylcytidine methyltransferase METTL6 isoform X2 [Impatiens glandulifera]
MSMEEAEYHSKDFEWDELRQEIETDPSMRFHMLPQLDNNSTYTNSSSDCSSPSEESEAWNIFHARHATGKFFKERRYLLKEFPELMSSDEQLNVLEVGCGNGSTALPILRNKSISVYACDCSSEALERAKEVIEDSSAGSLTNRFHPFIWDFSMNNRFPSCLPSPVDFVTLIFTLSAVPLHRMPTAIASCFSVLKPGGLLLFRDYGLYDMTMLRFGPDKKLGFREYLRSDGTHSYYFCLETARDLFTRAGFDEVELEYCCIKSVNRRNCKTMKRVWIHGKFQKPK